MSTPQASSSGAPPDYNAEEQKVPDPPSANQASPPYNQYNSPTGPQFSSGQQPVTQYGQAPIAMQYGQPPMQYGQAPMQPAVQYMVVAPPPKPNFHGPHTFIIIAIVIAVIGSLVNITSLAFGIPAIVCTIMSAYKKSNGQYAAATKLSSAALGLTITNIVYTLLIWMMTIWLLTDYDYYSYNNSFRSHCTILRYDTYRGGYYCTSY